AAELDGQVTGIADGDTLTISDSGEQVRIRVGEIDAPELKQDYGFRARESLAELCQGKHARIVVTGRGDTLNRVGEVYCGKVETAAEQVRRGMAWVTGTCTAEQPQRTLCALQEAAKQDKVGLWRERNPVAPWVWRERLKH